MCSSSSGKPRTLADAEVSSLMLVAIGVPCWPWWAVVTVGEAASVAGPGWRRCDPSMESEAVVPESLLIERALLARSHKPLREAISAAASTPLSES